MCFKTISEHACVQILRKKTVKPGFLKILTLADFHHSFGLFWLRRKGQISVKSQHDNGSVLAVELLRLWWTPPVTIKTVVEIALI